MKIGFPRSLTACCRRSTLPAIQWARLPEAEREVEALLQTGRNGQPIASSENRLIRMGRFDSYDQFGRASGSETGHRLSQNGGTFLVDHYKHTGKLPGKTAFSGRRRISTRLSGYSSHPDSTGGEFQRGEAPAFDLAPGETLVAEFSIPECSEGGFVGFGGWYCAPEGATVTLAGESAPTKRTLTPPAAPDWSKFGSMWPSTGAGVNVQFRLEATDECSVALWELSCGVIRHHHLDRARPELLKNMHRFSPEAHFIAEEGTTTFRLDKGRDKLVAVGFMKVPRKSCNRCARFLPINLNNERKHLSFSNHCVAAHRRPCSHSGFGTLRDIDSGDAIKLECGYQLECRFCKKFEVNAAHNPQRTSAQMKEDSARRRAFELLTSRLYGESAQLRYRHQTGRELADDVWERFGGKCFHCGQDLKPRNMHLDHTRPLALLWPLDGTATALCGSCNSQKRDRPPPEFYRPDQLPHLARLTGIPLEELKDPSPNIDAIRMLRARIDWFFDDFVTSRELQKIRDGKATAELLCKALQKAINCCPADDRFDLMAELSRRRRTS